MNLESHGKVLSERIAVLAGNAIPSVSSPRSESATSFRSSTTDERNLIDQLHSRIDALEYDNERLRSVNISGSNTLSDTQLQAAKQERDEAVRRIAKLEEELLASENTLKAQRTHASSLAQDYRQVTTEFEALQLSRSSGFEEMQKKLDDSDTLAKTLKDAADQQAIIAQQQEASCKSKDMEIAVLELRLENAYKELQDEKNELGAQIEELRMAGQVCPAYLCRPNDSNHLLKGNHRSL